MESRNRSPRCKLRRIDETEKGPDAPPFQRRLTWPTSGRRAGLARRRSAATSAIPPRRGTQSERPIHIDIIIQNVLKTITAMWHRFSVGPPEILAIQVIFRNRESALVHQSIMARAQQQQIAETGFTPCRPVLDMVGIDETFVRTAGEHAALVPRPLGTFDCPGHRAGLRPMFNGSPFSSSTIRHVSPSQQSLLTDSMGSPERPLSSLKAVRSTWTVIW